MTLTLLRQQQIALARWIQQPAPPGPTPLLRALQASPSGPHPGLDTYRQAWRGRLTEALRSNYPVLHRVLGDEAFAALTRAFIAEHPPHRPSIRWLGAGLPDWLAGQPSLVPHAALIDLARMEWALGLSFDSADAQPLTAANLGALSPEAWSALRFAPHPSVQCLALDWAVEPLWQQMTLAPERDDTAPPEPRVHTLLVWRQGLDSRWRSLPAGEAALLQAALAGLPFGELGQVAAEHAHPDQAPMLLASTLRTWLEHGLLIAPLAGGD